MEQEDGMSGIYIKGVELPANCGQCSEKIDPENRRCLADGHIFEETLGKLTNRRDANCPIFSVRPHGRLIDAAALTVKLLKLREYHLDGSKSRAAISNGISQCLDIINGRDCPTIIPAEESAP